MLLLQLPNACALTQGRGSLLYDAAAFTAALAAAFTAASTAAFTAAVLLEIAVPANMPRTCKGTPSASG
jgi:hypothetical protein